MLGGRNPSFPVGPAEAFLPDDFAAFRHRDGQGRHAAVDDGGLGVGAGDGELIGRGRSLGNEGRSGVDGVDGVDGVAENGG